MSPCHACTVHNVVNYQVFIIRVLNLMFLCVPGSRDNAELHGSNLVEQFLSGFWLRMGPVFCVMGVFDIIISSHTKNMVNGQIAMKVCTGTRG